MLVKENRVVTYTLNDISRDEYLTISAALSLLANDPNTRQAATARELLHQMGVGESTADAPITDPEPTRAIQVARMQDPNDDLSNPTISDDDPRPRRPVPGPAGGTFTRRSDNH